MRTRLIEVLDDGTQLYCLVTQFEEIDAENCKKIGIPTNYTIYNTFRGSYISTFAGYNFHPEYGESRVSSKEYSGTFKAIGTVIKFIENIKYLPDVLDVGAVRNFYNIVKGYDSVLEGVQESISDFNNEDLRKIIFKAFSRIHILIVHSKTKEHVYETSSSWNDEYAYSKYLWIPVPELDTKNIHEYEISPFKYEVL